MTERARRELLRELLALKRPTAEVLRTLARFGWDSDELVTLSAGEALRVVGRFLQGEVSEEDLEEWANGIEGREDVGFSPSNLREMIFELANPGLVGPVKQTAKKWAKILEEEGRPRGNDATV
jgi:hypothetical protein